MVRYHCPACAALPVDQLTALDDVLVHPGHAEHARQILTAGGPAPQTIEHASRTAATGRGIQLAINTHRAGHVEPATAPPPQRARTADGLEAPSRFADGARVTIPTAHVAITFVRVDGRWINPAAPDALTQDDEAIRGLWAVGNTAPHYHPGQP